MSKDKDNRHGRKAIDWLKAQYREGREFKNTADIAAGVATGCRIKPYFATRNACAWDRQARYELLTETIYVDPPVTFFGQSRTTTPSPKRRERSMAVRGKDGTTRLRNIAAYQAVAAQQPDATIIEQMLAAQWQAVSQFTTSLQKINNQILQERTDEIQRERTGQLPLTAPPQLVLVGRDRAAD